MTVYGKIMFILLILRNSKVDVMKELQKARMDCENLKRQMLQQEINFNIQKTEALTRYLGRDRPDFHSLLSFLYVTEKTDSIKGFASWKRMKV